MSKSILHLSAFTILVLTASGLQSQTSPPPAAQVTSAQIESISPPAIYIPVGGKQSIALLKGKGLEAILSAEILKSGKKVPQILTRLGPVSGGRVQVYFMAAPGTPLASDYRLSLQTSFGPILPNVQLEVVNPDDPRATQTVVQDASKLSQATNAPVIFAAPEIVPAVTQTIPQPLVIPANGTTQKIILKGANLDKVTQIRVRRAEKSTYAGGSGKLPFEFSKQEGSISLELSSSSPSDIGRKYVLDLIVGQYVATGVTFEIVAP